MSKVHFGCENGINPWQEMCLKNNNYREQLVKVECFLNIEILRDLFKMFENALERLWWVRLHTNLEMLKKSLWLSRKLQNLFSLKSSQVYVNAIWYCQKQSNFHTLNSLATSQIRSPAFGEFLPGGVCAKKHDQNNGAHGLTKYFKHS